MITHRWGKGDLSTREMSTVTDNPNPSLQLSLAGILGGRFQTTILLRTISLMLLKKKSDLIKHQCIKLPSTRSIDEEVFEVVKRKNVVRLYENRKVLGTLIGISDDEGLKCMRNVPDLMAEVAKNVLPIKRVLTARQSRSFLSLPSSLPLPSHTSLTLPLSNQQSLPLSISSVGSVLFDNESSKVKNDNGNNANKDSSIHNGNNDRNDDNDNSNNTHCVDPIENNNNNTINSTPSIPPPQSLPLSLPLSNSSKSDIYTILKEMTELTGRLSAEAYAFREPMIMRDDRLLRRGFIKQAKADYLELRRLVQGPHEVDSDADSLTKK